MFGACLPKVADPGGPAALPRGEMIRLIVQAVVVAARKSTSAIPHPEPALQRFREPVTGAPDFQWSPATLLISCADASYALAGGPSIVSVAFA